MCCITHECMNHAYITSHTNVSNSDTSNNLNWLHNCATNAQLIAQEHGLDQYCVYFHHCVFPPCPTQRHILTINNSPRCWLLLSREQLSLHVWSHKSNWDGKYLPCAKVIGKDFSWMLMLEKGCQSWKIIGLIAIDLKLCILSPMSWEMLQGILIWHCQKPARPTSASPPTAWAPTPTSPATPAGPKNKGVTCRQ